MNSKFINIAHSIDGWIKFFNNFSFLNINTSGSNNSNFPVLTLVQIRKNQQVPDAQAPLMQQAAFREYFRKESFHPYSYLHEHLSILHRVLNYFFCSKMKFPPAYPKPSNDRRPNKAETYSALKLFQFLQQVFWMFLKFHSVLKLWIDNFLSFHYFNVDIAGIFYFIT